MVLFLWAMRLRSYLAIVRLSGVSLLLRAAWGLARRYSAVRGFEGAWGWGIGGSCASRSLTIVERSVSFSG